MSDFARIGTNTGHGHAWQRPDGIKARCGGAAICQECGRDKALVDRWRVAGAQGVSADHGPIDPAFHAQMTALAAALDEMFNGKDCKAEDKKVGFFLATYEMNAPGRFNYISNSDKLDVRAMLKEITARIEGRLAATPSTKQ